MRVLLALGLALALSLLAGCGGDPATAPDPPPRLQWAGTLPFPDDSTVDVFVVPGYGLHLEQDSPDGGTVVRDVRVAFGPDPHDPRRTVERETVLRPDGSWYRRTWTYDPENPMAPVRIVTAVPGEEQSLTVERAGNRATYTLAWIRDGERREASATLDLSLFHADPALEPARARFREAFAGFAVGSRLLDSPDAGFLDALSGHADLAAALGSVAPGTKDSEGFDAYLREFCAMGRNIQKTVCALSLFFPQFSGLCAASVPATGLCDLILVMRTAQITLNDPSQPDTVCGGCWSPPDSGGSTDP